MKRYITPGNTDPRNTSKSAHNIIKLMFELMGDGANITEICNILAISNRTAFRYLKQIADEGFKVYRDDKTGKYHIGKGKRMRKDGAPSKPIYQFSKDGALMKVWGGANVMAAHFNVSASKVRTAIYLKTFFNKTLLSYENVFIKKEKKENKRKVPVYLFSPINELVGEYPSITECAEDIGKTTGFVTNAIRYENLTKKGFYISKNKRYKVPEKTKKYKNMRVDIKTYTALRKKAKAAGIGIEEYLIILIKK